MDNALRRLALLFALALPCHAQGILAPILFGSAASAPSYSQVRCTASQQYVAQSSLTVNLPSCATAGDLIILYFSTQVSAGNGGNNAPTAWSYSGGSFWGSCLYYCSGQYAKILTSADISAGSSTWALTTTGNAIAISVEFNGPTGGFTIGDTAYTSAGSVSTLGATSPIAIQADDTVLFFGGCSCNTAISSNLGATLETQTIAATTGGSALATYVHYSSSTTAPTATFTMGTYAPGGSRSVSAVIVVHGVQWTPRSIPGLQAWYSADCITMSGTVCATPSTGTHPTAWYNQSIYATSAVTGGSNVTFNTGQINGEPAVTFASTSYVTLAMPTDTEWLKNPNVSFAGVWANTGTASKGTIFGGPLYSYAYWTCQSSIQQGVDSQNHANLGWGTAACDTSFHQANAEFIYGTSLSFRINEATDATQSPSLSPSNPSLYTSVIGYNKAGSSEYFNGKLSEAMFYTHALQSSEITALESYFHAKYGI